MTALADEGLDDHAHQRGEDPEERQLVGIGAQGGEDAADVRALQGVCDLDTQEAETQVHQLTECQVTLIAHGY